jgi:hypothetical protein
MEEFKFYIVDDLKRMSEIKRFDNLNDALHQYHKSRSLQTNIRTALGIEYKSSSIDLIHKFGKYDTRVNDYMKIQQNSPMYNMKYKLEKVVDGISQAMDIRYQVCSQLLGRFQTGVCIIPITKHDSYIDGKILDPCDSMGNPRSAFNEARISDLDGNNCGCIDWIGLKKLMENEKCPVIEMVNVSYVELDQWRSQMDIMPASFIEMAENLEHRYILETFDEMRIVNNQEGGGVLRVASFESKQQAVNASFHLSSKFFSNQKILVFDTEEGKHHLIFDSSQTQETPLLFDNFRKANSRRI